MRGIGCRGERSKSGRAGVSIQWFWGRVCSLTCLFDQNIDEAQSYIA